MAVRSGYLALAGEAVVAVGHTPGAAARAGATALADLYRAAGRQVEEMDGLAVEVVRAPARVAEEARVALARCAPCALVAGGVL